MLWKFEKACIIRENIDPKHLGLHVHHRSVRMLKTHQSTHTIRSEGVIGHFLALAQLGGVSRLRRVK